MNWIAKLFRKPQPPTLRLVNPTPIVDQKPMGFGKSKQVFAPVEIECECDTCGNEWVEITKEPLKYNEYRVYEKCSCCMSFKS